jgi:hypothetical protein
LTVNPTVSAPSGPLAFALAGPGAAVKTGKRGKSILIITNISGQTIKQSLSISLVLSSDDTLAGQIAGLLSVGKKINLKAGRSKSFSLAFKIPAVSAGSYALLGQIDSGSVFVASSPVTVVVTAPKK